MSHRKQERKRVTDERVRARVAPQIVSPVYAPPARANPFLCTVCSAAAVWRHYDPTTNAHVASFCSEHTPMFTHTAAIVAPEVPQNTDRYLPADATNAPLEPEVAEGMAQLLERGLSGRATMAEQYRALARGNGD